MEPSLLSQSLRLPISAPNGNSKVSVLTKPVYPLPLFVSFGLLCGGAIFMESCDSVVYSMEYYGVTPMFTLNLNLGFVALIMAWVISVFSIKTALVARMSAHGATV
ncbi:hypothetical protein JCM33374_g6684 [Metschnikowia sp. JCM 33374]|nr:hypothetical protein JCM33374_g6684 [Metschnikowia sp. JCM 33374]